MSYTVACTRAVNIQTVVVIIFYGIACNFIAVRIMVEVNT